MNSVCKTCGERCEVGTAVGALNVESPEVTYGASITVRFCRMQNNDVTAMQNFSLGFGLLQIANEPVLLLMWNLLCSGIIDMPYLRTYTVYVTLLCNCNNYKRSDGAKL